MPMTLDLCIARVHRLVEMDMNPAIGHSISWKCQKYYETNFSDKKSPSCLE